jgi:hypothetical protein
MASTNDMLTMTLSQHLTIHWISLQIEATHTQDGGFERDSRDQTCSLVFVGSVDETVSWSAYHSSKWIGPHVNISIS